MSDSLTLTPAFRYIYASHEVYPKVSALVKNDSNNHVQHVPPGASVYSTATKAGAWLSNAGVGLGLLVIVAHGSPGQLDLGQTLTSQNIAPLGGWLQSFFDDDAAGIRILGCECAADSSLLISGLWRGQDHPRSDTGVSHRGYELLLKLAEASKQKVEGALNGQEIAPMRLQGTCRRVFPNGQSVIFQA